MTDFEKSVYKFIASIPVGKVATYAQVAVGIGKPKAVRAVGNALNKNPNAPAVPCHRVVRSNGDLGGYAFGLIKKINLLENEKVEVVNGRVDLDKCGI